LTVDQARGVLEQASLTLGNVGPAFDEEVPKGQVISWRWGQIVNPTEATKGEPIDLVVSDGPQPRTIKDYKGADPNTAKAELEAAGLVVQLKDAFSDDVEKGKVTGTDPEAGKTAEKGSTVTIYVSKGQDLVTVPDVSQYATLDQAEAALEEAGLHLGETVGTRGATRPASSDPVAGTRVKRGTDVDIFLRR
jgi:serine/threonine-protein kinase